MKLKLLDKSGLIVIFILGGLYGFTDFNGPKDAGTFLGSAMVVMFISLGIGWVLNKVLRVWSRYKDKAEKMNRKISPTIVIGILSSLVMLIKGVSDLNAIEL
jgi:hypothetical protein